MRQTMFGDTIIEDASDDLGSVEALQDAGDEIYAVIRLDEEDTQKYEFAVMHNEDGEDIVSSEPIFETSQDAAAYLHGFVTDIQYD